MAATTVAGLTRRQPPGDDVFVSAYHFDDDRFRRSAQVLGTVAAGGLPTPRIEPVDAVHLAHLRERATT